VCRDRRARPRHSRRNQRLEWGRLGHLLEANDRLPKRSSTTSRDNISIDRDDYDIQDYDPEVTSSDETTTETRDIFRSEIRASIGEFARLSTRSVPSRRPPAGCRSTVRASPEGRYPRARGDAGVGRQRREDGEPPCSGARDLSEGSDLARRGRTTRRSRPSSWPSRLAALRLPRRSPPPNGHDRRRGRVPEVVVRRDDVHHLHGCGACDRVVQREARRRNQRSQRDVEDENSTLQDTLAGVAE